MEAQGDITVSIGNFGTYNVATTPRTVAVYKTVYPPGDLNKSGEVDMQDVLAIYAHFRGITPLTGPALDAAHMNNDGKIDLQDVLLAYQAFRMKP